MFYLFLFFNFFILSVKRIALMVILISQIYVISVRIHNVKNVDSKIEIKQINVSVLRVTWKKKRQGIVSQSFY